MVKHFGHLTHSYVVLPQTFTTKDRIVQNVFVYCSITFDLSWNLTDANMFQHDNVYVTN